MPISPADHMTSFLYVLASSFAKNENNTAIRSSLSVIGDRFARFLPPNFCVQLPESGVLHKELRMFLAPAMRNSLTMCHVFKMKLRLVASDDADARIDTADELKLLFSDMRSKLTYITRLDVKLDRKFSSYIAGSSLQTAMFASLPVRLQSFSLNTHGILVGAENVRALGALPHLRELRLLSEVLLSQAGLVELLRPDSKPPTDNGVFSSVFFPALRRLQVSAAYECGGYFKVIMQSVAAKSVILPQLIEFGLGCADLGDGDLDPASLRPLLESLSHLRILGSNALAGLKLSGQVDLSPLHAIEQVGSFFLHKADFRSSGSNTLDLTSMSALEEVGSYFLAGAAGIKNVILPSSNNIRHIGEGMCHNATITALDLSPVRDSLQSIELTNFANYSRLVKFDTTPLAGKIRDSASYFLMYTRRLVEVDLSGFVGVRSLGAMFLYSCAALKAVRGMTALSCVEVVENDFFANTSNLVECDLKQMLSLRRVGPNCLKSSGLEMKVLDEIMAANGANG